MRAVLPIALLSAFTVPGTAQVPQQRLSDPDAVYEESLSGINGLRELPDGRVMVADGLGQALIVMDLSTGRADTIGGVGGGPQEYRTPDAIFPLPGDSTLLVDLGNGRLTAIGPDFAFGETMPLTLGQPGRGPGGFTVLIPRAVDSQGRMYIQSSGGVSTGGPADSTYVVRYDRTTRQLDSLVRIRLGQRRMSRSGSAGNQNVQIRPVPLSPQDGWGVAPDGRIAMVRTDRYRVEWRDTNGRAVTGPAVEYRPVRVGTDEKNRWLDNMGRGGLRVGVSVNNGEMQTAFSRGGGNDQRPDPDQYEWPDVMPAFDAAEVMVDPNGNVWVGRYTSAGQPPLFDVFDGEGRLRAQITLPEGREIAGFGNGVVYLTRYDEFDLQYLERYRVRI